MNGKPRFSELTVSTLLSMIASSVVLYLTLKAKTDHLPEFLHYLEQLHRPQEEASTLSLQEKEDLRHLLAQFHNQIAASQQLIAVHNANTDQS